MADGFGGVSRDDDGRHRRRQRLASRMTVSPSMPGHLQIDDQQVIGVEPKLFDRAPPVGDRIDIVIASIVSVFDSSSRMLASSSTTSIRGRSSPAPPRCPNAGAGAGAARSAPGTLAVEPCIDVALAEAPLAPDANSRNLAGFDQTVHRPQIDLEILEHLFGRQKCLYSLADSSRLLLLFYRKPHGEQRPSVRVIRRATWPPWS